MPEPITPASPSSVSVSDMARMVGLSRSRFHQLLQSGVFPKPSVDPESKRPFYDSEQQTTCLRVRQTNQGVNGQRVMFYSRPFGAHLAAKPRPLGAQSSSSARRKKTEVKQTTSSKPSKLDVLVEGLKTLDQPQLLCGKRGPLTTQGVRDLFAKYSAIVGVRIHPHLLRHCFGREFLASNQNDLVGLAALMGHENLNTTRRYVARTTEQLCDAAENMAF